MPKKTQDELARAIAKRRREIAAETRKLDAKIVAQVPAIRELAEHGKVKERKLARRWLALANRGDLCHED